MTIVTGLDLSLTSAGVCQIDTGAAGFYTQVLSPPKLTTGLERLNWLLHATTEHCAGGVQLVVVEGPSYGNQGSGRQSGHHERAGLWWLVRRELWRWGVPVAVVPPASLKRYACGKGNAGKDEMLLATARRFSAFAGGNDEADALWLAHAGADHLGLPLVEMPKVQRAALDAVQWPKAAP